MVGVGVALVGDVHSVGLVAESVPFWCGASVVLVLVLESYCVLRCAPCVVTLGVGVGSSVRGCCAFSCLLSPLLLLSASVSVC